MAEERIYFGRAFHMRREEHPIFAIAEAQVAEEIKDDPHIANDGKWILDVPMPYLHAPKNKRPVIVTKDWAVKTEKKRQYQIAKEKRILQEEIYEYLADRDVIMNKLARLDKRNPKHKKKIVKYNIDIRNIDAHIQMLENQAGVTVNHLEHGNKFQRVIGRIKNTLQEVGHKIKKFVKKYSYIIQPIAVIAVAAFASSFATKLSGLIGALIG